MEWTDCPSEQQLHDFAMGRLPDSLIERIGSHAEECEQCGQRLDAFETSAPGMRQVFADEDEGSESSDRLFDGLVKRVLQSRISGQVARESGAEPSNTPTGPSSEDNTDAGNHLRPGEKFGTFEIVEHLGEGTFGTVYRAHHQALKRDVVLKYLKPHMLELPEVRKRFEREMEAIGQLDHPNLVKASDAGEVDAVPFIAMEFHPGQTVNQILRRQAYVEELMACDIIRQAAKGLFHAHQKGLIHRDIKPSNVLVGDDGCVKILDLGLALFAPQRADVSSDRRTGLLDSRSHDSRRVTRAGTAVGTKAYMAPEQWADSHHVDHRADIYSLGCLFHMLLTGEHAGQSEATKMPLAHQSRRIRRLPESHPLRPILARMLALDPENRYATADAVASEMDRYIEQAGTSNQAAGTSNQAAGAMDEAAGAGPESDVEPPAPIAHQEDEANLNVTDYQIATPRFAKARRREERTILPTTREGEVGPTENAGDKGSGRSKWLLPILLIGLLLVTSAITAPMLWWGLSETTGRSKTVRQEERRADEQDSNRRDDSEGSPDEGAATTDVDDDDGSSGTRHIQDLSATNQNHEAATDSETVDPSADNANSLNETSDDRSDTNLAGDDSNTGGEVAPPQDERQRPTRTSPGILRLGMSDSLKIEGTNELVNGNEPVTIEFWFRTRGVGIFEQTLLTTAKTTRGIPRHFQKKDIGWRLAAREFGNNTRLELFDPSGDLVGASGHMIPAGTAMCDAWGDGWHHLALMRDNQQFTVFIDGTVRLRHVRHHSAFVEEGEVESADLHLGSIGVIGPPQGLEADIRGLRISEGLRYKRGGFEPPLLFDEDEATACLLDFTTDSTEEIGDLTGNGFKGIIRGASWLYR